MAFLNGFRIWLYGHLAFIVLCAVMTGWAAIFLEMVAFFASIPGLILFVCSGRALRRAKIDPRWKATCFALSCLLITGISICLATQEEAGGGDSFSVSEQQQLRLAAIATGIAPLLHLPAFFRPSPGQQHPASVHSKNSNA